MIRISNKKAALTRATLKQALNDWADMYGKRGVLNVEEVTIKNGLAIWDWGNWSAKGTFKELTDKEVYHV